MTSWQTRLLVLLLSGAAFGTARGLAAQDAVAPEAGEITIRHLDKGAASSKAKDPMLGVSVQSIDVDADIQGLNARTTTTYVFKNDADKPAECTFTFPLPENAAVDRFAMTINDKEMLEGTAVYSGDAEAIYRDLLDGNDGTCTAKDKVSKVTIVASLGGRGSGGGASLAPRLTVPHGLPAHSVPTSHQPLTALIMSAPVSHSAPQIIDKFGTHTRETGSYSVANSQPVTYGMTYQTGFGSSNPVSVSTPGFLMNSNLHEAPATHIYMPYKDPGVLERIGTDLYRATVFAVEPHKSKTIVVSCVHPLAVSRNSPDSTEAVYRIPFMGLGGLVPAPRVTLHSVLRNPAADATVRASLDSNITRKGGDMLIVTEVQKPTDRMAWTIAVGTPAADVLNASGCAVQAFRPDKNEPGYFALTVLPKDGAQPDIRRPMDTVFVVDCSVAVSDSDRKSRREFLDTLLTAFNPDDRFAVVALGAQPLDLPGALQAVDGTSVERTQCLIDGLESNERPDVRAGFERVLELCQPQLERRVNVVFLGAAIAENHPEWRGRIREVLTARNAGMFAVRLGSHFSIDPLFNGARDANTLAELSGAPVTELAPGVRAADTARRLLTRLHGIVLRDAALELTTADGKTVTHANPIQGGLMLGESSTFYGTYAGAGAARAVLTGTLNGAPYRREWNITLPAEEKTNPALAKLWTRAQGALAADGDSPNIDLYLTAIKNQVVNRNVAFLVLDGEARYKKLNIARPADGFHVAPLSPDVSGAARPEDEVIGERK